MARSSPSVGRVASVLNFIAQRPNQSFTLTDLTQSLQLNLATCHALLASLVKEGYLYRGIDKSYVLGPALVSVGYAAAQQYSPMRIAKPEMRALAEDFEVVCSMLNKDGYESVVQAQVVGKAHAQLWVKEGARLFLRPPFGGVYYSRAPQTDVQLFLDHCDPTPTPEHRTLMHRSIEFVRQHGFALGVRNPDFPVRWEGQDLRFNIDDILFSRERDRFAVKLQTEVTSDRVYDVAYLTAPVFTETGRVAFTVSLSHFSRTVTGDRIKQIGRQLRKVCDRIGGYLKEEALERTGVLDDCETFRP